MKDKTSARALQRKSPDAQPRTRAVRTGNGRSPWQATFTRRQPVRLPQPLSSDTAGCSE